MASLSAFVCSRERLVVFVISVFFTLVAAAEDTTSVGQITVESNAPGNGLMIQEDTPKARSSVTRSAIEQNSGLNNPFQMINLLPGVYSFSPDGTGLFSDSGVGLSMRGFSGSQIGVTVDGVPVNDSGNFGVYPAEFGEPENLQEIFITQGSSETDAPHVGSSGGNIGLVTSSPLEKSRMLVQQTFGNYNARKTYARLDSGYLLDNKLKSFISYSEATADKWKGTGKADRKHLDFKSVLDIKPGNTITAGLQWQRIFNNNLRTLTLAQIAALGRNADFGTIAPQHLTSVNGAPVVEAPSADPNYHYYNLSLNPFDVGIATLKGNFQLSPTLRLDVEPYYLYEYGMGGDELSTLKEGNSLSQFGGGIRDINHNGNTLDTVLVYRGTVTETHRHGVTVRLSTQIDNQKLMLGYWYEYAHHGRTQPAVPIDSSGNSVDPWLQNPANYLLLQNGTPYQGRNYLTINKADSLFLQDDISLMNDKLKLVPGVHTTGLKRDFTNYPSNGGGDGASYTAQGEYFKTLPSLGARYQLNNERQLFFNVANNFSAPPDSIFYGLLNGGAIVNGVLTGATMSSVNVTAQKPRPTMIWATATRARI